MTAPVPKITASTTRGGAPAQERKLRTQGKETLRKLLDAGMATFEARGYYATRVDDIVSAASTSHGTFYLYFANKEDLFWALLSDVAEEMTALSASLGPVPSGRKGFDEVRNWLGRFFDLYCRYSPVLRAWTESDSPEMNAFGADVLDRFTRGLVERISAADPPPGVDPDVAGLAMAAMVERISFYIMNFRDAAAAHHMLDTVAAMIHVGVFGGSKARGVRT